MPVDPSFLYIDSSGLTGADVSKSFNPNQSALIDLAKSGKRTGISPQESSVLKEWANEYKVPFRVITVVVHGFKVADTADELTLKQWAFGLSMGLGALYPGICLCRRELGWFNRSKR